jgi:hypothetical protein
MAERRKVYWVFVDERQLAIRGGANPLDPFFIAANLSSDFKELRVRCKLARPRGKAVLAIFAAIRHVDVVGGYDTADRHILFSRAANADKNLKFWVEINMRVGDGVLRWMRSGTGLSHNDEPILAYIVKGSTFVDRAVAALYRCQRLNVRYDSLQLQVEGGDDKRAAPVAPLRLPTHILDEHDRHADHLASIGVCS